MPIPALATIAYTVPVGKQSTAQVINTFSQDVGASGYAGPVPPATLPFGAGPLLEMQWPAAIHDVTALSLDGLTVRRLITFPTPGIPAGGTNPPYRNANALKACLRNLYTRQLEAFCGTKVTALEPVVFDTPITIFSTLPIALDSWWHAEAVGSAASVFTPASWPSDGVLGAGRVLAQAVAGDQATLVAQDQFAGRGGATTADNLRWMLTNAPNVLIPQPFTTAVVALSTAGNTVFSGRAADNNELARVGGSLDYTTDGVGIITSPLTPAGQAAFVGAVASDANSQSMIRNGLDKFTGTCGPGAPDGLTLFNNVAHAAGMVGSVASLILINRAVTDDEWSALYDFARGWYGVDLW